jgi:AraC-like DNA-binding protein/tetratricopeptide (TPR) repeat protein
MRYLLVFFFCVVSLEVTSQSHLLDSLYTALENHPEEDSLRVNIIISICWHEYTFRPEKNKELALHALALSKRLNYTKGKSNAIRALGLYYWATGEYEKATQCAYDMLKISDITNYSQGSGQAYQLLALINQLDSEPEKATDFYNKALSIFKKENLKGDIAACFNLMGTFYMSLSKLNLASEYFFKSAAVAKKIKDEDRISAAYANLGLLYSQEKDFTKAEIYFKKSLDVALRLSNTYRMTLIFIGMGSMYTSNGQYERAESFLRLSLMLAKSIHHKKKLEEIYDSLMRLEQRRKNFQIALSYFDLRRAYRDSIYTEDKARKITEIETQYETEKKDQLIKLLERDQHIKLLWKNILIGCLTLVTLLSFVVYFLQRYKQRKNRELLELQINSLIVQRNELSEKYKNFLTPESEPTLVSQDQLLLKKVIDIVERNMGDPLFGVDKMAEDMGMSRTNLHRKLKAIIGFPPSELIRGIRMRKAALLIRNETDSISQISFMVGFEDSSYFSKAFKKQFGVLPSEYLQFSQKTELKNLQPIDVFLAKH